ncbi:50S ribosomal protein L25 [Parasphaerochaeta coccoides]|uniref:Large ribosomal subunit protein bL25 n=1 Tax=Parasphaerochaeta coccoides (strain ATCC BAA-1237 / DSM 17374 / SPN1) TaxID=760011 RepID=F4GIR3_PARC1|nr:50S ribosomal protein L25 [Parasphaerochaeta coccoides]AEC02197.1 50S ribosomal protein L25 [Parasphaerochaeta coccoides DSM 17374]
MKDTSKTLSAELRTGDFGSSGSRRVVRSGKIPAVIYGKNTPLHITIDAQEFRLKRRYFTETSLLSIVLSKKKHECLVKDVQEDLLNNRIKHVDFYEVTSGQTLHTRVNIELTGNPVGARDGGVLEHILFDIEIESLPANLPEVIRVDVSQLGLNDVLTVGDVVWPVGVKALADAETAVATVKSIREELPGSGEAGSSEPEVIKEKKEKAE